MSKTNYINDDNDDYISDSKHVSTGLKGFTKARLFLPVTVYCENSLLQVKK